MKTTKHLKTKLSSLILLAGLAAQPGYSALVDMAEYQDWDALQASISNEDINAVQPDGMTALFWAVYHDQADVVSLLLNAGANPDASNRYGMTPLIQAAMNGNSEIISMLLDAGVNPNEATLQGDTALMNAAQTGALNGVEALIDAGADIEARDSYYYQTPLMWGAAADNVEVVRALIDAGAEVNARSAELIFAGVAQEGRGVGGDFPNGGLSALHHAARENAIETAKLLLEAGADPDMHDPRGMSPLRVAVANSNLDLVKVMIESGADLNDGALIDIIETEYKEIAFVRAEKNYDNKTTVRELVDLMFEMGVDPDSYPEMPIPFQSTNFIGGHGQAGRTALYNETEELHNDWVSYLLERGANPDAVTKEGNSPLSAALYIMSGRRPDAGIYDDEGRSLEKIMPTVQILLDHGADVNSLVGEGQTLVHQAAAYGNNEVIEFLVAQGVDLSVKDDSNRTALDVASGVPSLFAEVEMNAIVPKEIPVYEETMALLTEAMNEAGIAIEEYVAPPAPEVISSIDG